MYTFEPAFRFICVVALYAIFAIAALDTYFWGMQCVEVIILLTKEHPHKGDVSYNALVATIYFQIAVVVWGIFVLGIYAKNQSR